MAGPHRSTITIGGKKFHALSTTVGFTTLKDRAGMPEMGSLATGIKVWVDFHDADNLQFDTLKELFTLANIVTRDKIKEISIVFWRDDAQSDALCSFSFNGWISRFEVSNPMADSSPQTTTSTTSPVSTVNHLLYLELEPALDQQNFTNIAISN